jgi:sugar phosphate isomerase/epimerase
MHLSTHTWMRAERLETTLRRAKRLGYSSIEISGEPGQYDLAETCAPPRQCGIGCGAVTLTLGSRNLASADALIG